MTKPRSSAFPKLSNNNKAAASPSVHERPWPGSRHTTLRAAVGPVLDLVLNDFLSIILPTHAATHLFKVLVVTCVLLVLPFWLANNNLLMPWWCAANSCAATDDDDKNPFTMGQAERNVWLAAISLLSVFLWCNYQRRILWLLWKLPVWMDPTKMCDDARLPVHAANLRFFESTQMARKAACCPDALVHAQHPIAPTRHVVNLDGNDWQFQLCRTVQKALELAVTAIDTTVDNNVKNSSWPCIVVPSNWMLQPNVADIPIYTNQKCKFDTCHLFNVSTLSLL